MWSLERLRLTLPPGFEHRAEPIVRQLAEELAALPISRDVRLESLTLPPIAMDAGAGDGEIAARIAGALRVATQTQGGRGC
jgi:hypothetical protein